MLLYGLIKHVLFATDLKESSKYETCYTVSREWVLLAEMKQIELLADVANYVDDLTAFRRQPRRGGGGCERGINIMEMRKQTHT
jgi:hypothetical protein